MMIDSYDMQVCNTILLNKTEKMSAVIPKGCQRLILPILSTLFLSLTAAGQVAETGTSSTVKLAADVSKLSTQSSLLENLDKSIVNLSNKATKKSANILNRLRRKELKLMSQLSVGDSIVLKQIQSGFDEYNGLLSQVQTASKGTLLAKYNPHLDSLRTSLSFLSHVHSDYAKSKSKEVLDKLDLLENKFQTAADVSTFLKRRRELLSKYISNSRLARQFNDYNKQAFYFNQQMSDYKTLIDDPKRIGQKFLSVIEKQPAFQQFFKEHSQLAALFRLPDGYGSSASLAGLQTTDQVQSSIMSRLGEGQAGQQLFDQGVQQAQTQVRDLANKVSSKLSTGDGMDMPDFKPNAQKTKPLLERLEYGINIQSVKSNYFFPTTSDLAVSVGYKLNEKSVVGLGAAYKLGWGRDIQHVRVSHQGVGVRSYIDWKIRGSFYLSGGYEKNYRAEFQNIRQLSADATQWQQSALIGICKKYQTFKRKGEIKVLYDFLHDKQTPLAPPVLVRFGYKI
jgi:hypothetical protein